MNLVMILNPSLPFPATISLLVKLIFKDSVASVIRSGYSNFVSDMKTEKYTPKIIKT